MQCADGVGIEELVPLGGILYGIEGLVGSVQVVAHNLCPQLLKVLAVRAALLEDDEGLREQVLKRCFFRRQQHQLFLCQGDGGDRLALDISAHNGRVQMAAQTSLNCLAARHGPDHRPHLRALLMIAGASSLFNRNNCQKPVVEKSEFWE